MWANAPKNDRYIYIHFLKSNDDSKIDHYSTHIYITYFIYVYQNGRNWKFQNSPFKTTYIYLTLIYVPLIGENWKSKKDKI